MKHIEDIIDWRRAGAAEQFIIGLSEKGGAP